MASLDDLKKRIVSVKSTQKITKAMKIMQEIWQFQEHHLKIYQ